MFANSQAMPPAYSSKSNSQGVGSLKHEVFVRLVDLVRVEPSPVWFALSLLSGEPENDHLEGLSALFSIHLPFTTNRKEPM